MLPVVRFSLFHCCKSVLQICQNIINMLCSDRKADSILLNSLIGKLFIGQLGMCGRCRMNNQALHICYVSKKGEDLQIVDKLMGFCLTTLDFKGKDRSSAIREVLFIKGMIRMIRQGRMAHLFYLRMVL